MIHFFVHLHKPFRTRSFDVDLDQKQMERGAKGWPKGGSNT
jgi:hypothetical protein